MTTSQTYADIRWNREQNFLSRSVAAEEFKSRILTPEAVIEMSYDFAPDHRYTRENGYGQVVQMGMRLTAKGDKSHALTVVCCLEGKDLFWAIEDMSECPLDAQVYIRTVQARIARNAAQRGAVN